MCKNYSVKDWMAFAEVYGMPLRIGRYEPAASEVDIGVLKNAIRQLGHDAGAVLPKNMEIEFQDAARMTGSSNSDPVFGKLAKFCNDEVSKAILGQTASTEGTPGRLGSDEAQENVRDDIRDNDAEQLAATIQRDLVNPLIDLNWGPREPHEYPIISLAFEQPEDLKLVSDAMVPFIAAGLRVEAQWVRDKFGAEMPEDGAEIIGEKTQEEKDEEAAAKAKADAAFAAAAAGNGNGGEPTPPAPGEPGEPAPGEPSEEAMQRAVALVVNALKASTTEEIVNLSDAEAKNWRAQMDPIVGPIMALAKRSKNFEAFVAGLDKVLSEMDDTIFLERLATSTYKARGLGDGKDSPAELASMGFSELIAIMAKKHG